MEKNKLYRELNETLRKFSGPMTSKDVYKMGSFVEATPREVKKGLEGLFQQGRILKLVSQTPDNVSSGRKKQYGQTFYLY